MRPFFTASRKWPRIATSVIFSTLIPPFLNAQINALSDASEIEGTGVYNSPWLGIYSQSTPEDPWIFSDMIGWTYTVDDSEPDAVWMYNEELAGWIWTKTEFFPYTYSETLGWIYFERIEPLSYYYSFDDDAWYTIEKSWYSPDLNDVERASRFLAQATLGADFDTIYAVARSGLEAWIDAQFQIPVTTTADPVEVYIEQTDELVDQLDYRALLFRAAWWKNVISGSDLLRQRVALALSEILVISDIGELGEHPEGLAGYFDILQNNAFGNYRDLLYDITIHPTMGHYLSHMGNRKPDSSTGRFPDENYAREVMQLFTIGLYELNMDGSRKLDSNGEPIPTYDNSDITEFARVYTGMHFDTRFALEELAEDPEFPNPPTIETITFEEIETYELFNYADPMYFYESEHDNDAKTLLNDTVLPAGQTVQQDLNGALDNLFNHPSTAPFVSKLLIQRLTKSNPSPAYIERVANTFADNGSGVRGDMKAILKAILLDVEARSPDMLKDSKHAKMREPYFMLIHYMRAFNARPEGDDYFLLDADYFEAFSQRPFSSPSVFNFFLPDYSPPGAIGDAGLVAPEFQIANSFSLSAALNLMHWSIVGDSLQLSEPDEEDIQLGLDRFMPRWTVDLSAEVALINDLDALLNHLDLILTYGRLSEGSKAIIKSALEQGEDAEAEELVRLAIYFILTSPDYNITR
ncbi:MAG: DUF1800 domain-containing protein [Opitutales bacterium]